MLIWSTDVGQFLDTKPGTAPSTHPTPTPPHPHPLTVAAPSPGTYLHGTDSVPIAEIVGQGTWAIEVDGSWITLDAQCCPPTIAPPRNITRSVGLPSPTPVPTPRSRPTSPTDPLSTPTKRPTRHSLRAGKSYRTTTPKTNLKSRKIKPNTNLKSRVPRSTPSPKIPPPPPPPRIPYTYDIGTLLTEAYEYDPTNHVYRLIGGDQSLVFPSDEDFFTGFNPDMHTLPAKPPPLFPPPPPFDAPWFTANHADFGFTLTPDEQLILSQ